MATNAGLNVCTNFEDMEAFVPPLRDCIKKGKVTEETINSRVGEKAIDLSLFRKEPKVQ